jgi:hypothetical protein
VPWSANPSTIPDMDANKQPKSDAERAAYAERLVTDTVARLDAQRQSVSDRVTNLVIHAGDTIAADSLPGGRYEYRFFDQGGDHYATLSGHHNPNGHFVVDAIGYHPTPVGRRVVLPVRADSDPKPEPYAYPNSITIPTDPYALSGDPPAVTFGSRPVVTISHQHEHIHTRDDDPLALAYRHNHSHEHTGASGTIWLAEHVREAHDHPHQDADFYGYGGGDSDDRPDNYPDGWTKDA